SPISSLPPFMVGGAVDWCVMMSSLDASLSVMPGQPIRFAAMPGVMMTQERGELRMI
ncbi:hypothetical protein Tco_1442520, partial [Tanacetum coccineum]